jgi:hypothetical protein
MQFVKLKSRGGDYLVVAENVAWLRSHEDNQTKVGIIGSDYILVAGSIEETAAKILEGGNSVTPKSDQGQERSVQINYWSQPRTS